MTTVLYRATIYYTICTAFLCTSLCKTSSAQNGPSCDKFININIGLGNISINKVFAIGSTVYVATKYGLAISTNEGYTYWLRGISNGLGDDFVTGVFVTGNTIYAATLGGLSISTDGGASFVNRTTADGLGSNTVYRVVVLKNIIYASTQEGLSISTDGGASFVNRTTADGLGSNTVASAYAVGDTVYAATFLGGLSISTNGGLSFINKTTEDGLANIGLTGVYAVGKTIYVATSGNGLSISTDGGKSFVTRNESNGLGEAAVNEVFAIGNTVYAATLNGLSISLDGGKSFTTRTIENGLGTSSCNGVYAVGDKIYVATNFGLSSCSNTPLSVKLVYFKGQRTTEGARLEWQTANEINNSVFRIQRSHNLISFETIGSQSSLAKQGTSHHYLTYSFTDLTPLSGLNYYRLEQVDLDGQYTFSQSIVISNEDVSAVLYPNPVSFDGQVYLKPAQAYDSYDLTDIEGQIIQASIEPGMLSQVNLVSKPIGIYFLRLQRNHTQQVYRIAR